MKENENKYISYVAEQTEKWKKVILLLMGVCHFIFVFYFQKEK